MKTGPGGMPSVPARIVHHIERPSIGPTNPIGIEKYWKLPRNQSGAWCQIRPWRSVSGTQSMERASIAMRGLSYAPWGCIGVHDRFLYVNSERLVCGVDRHQLGAADRHVGADRARVAHL